MPKDHPKSEEQSYRPPDEAQAASEMGRLISTIDRVFSTFRAQLQIEVPKPFNGNGKIAVDTFNDIVAGLKFESGRPRAITIAATTLSSTEIELRWTDLANNADGYRVLRCEGHNCHDLDEIERLTSAARSFRDANLSRHTPYCYQVIAFNARGETSSNIVEVDAAIRGEGK